MRMEWGTGRDERMTVSLASDGLVAAFKGRIEADFLARTLDDLHKETLTRRHRGVILDVTEVEPLDASAVKAVIKWAMRQAELEAVERYEVVLRYADGVSWQKVSLAAIAHLCPYVRLAPSA